MIIIFFITGMAVNVMIIIIVIIITINVLTQNSEQHGLQIGWDPWTC